MGKKLAAPLIVVVLAAVAITPRLLQRGAFEWRTVLIMVPLIALLVGFSQLVQNTD